MSYRVRRALVADVPDLACFMAIEGAAGRAALRHALESSDDFRCWVAECGARIVAAMAVRTAGGAGRPCWLIESIHVEPAHRKRGLTRLLLDALRAEASRHGVRELLTKCEPGGEQAECLLKGRLY